jgi:hypothetical protein
LNDQHDGCGSCGGCWGCIEGQCTVNWDTRQFFSLARGGVVTVVTRHFNFCALGYPQKDIHTLMSSDTDSLNTSPSATSCMFISPSSVDALTHLIVTN